MDQILRELDAIRRRAHIALILQRIGWPIAVMVALLIVLALADFLLRLPEVVRAMQLVAIMAALLFGIQHWIVPAVRLRATVVDIALRIERLMPELGGRLASAVEFSAAGLDHRSDLAARAVDEAVRRARGRNLRAVARYQPTALSMTSAFMALLLVVALYLAMPVHAAVAARRLLLPLSEAQWPRQTSVHNAMDAHVLPRGRMVPLRARVLRGFDRHMRVYASYRFQNEADAAFGPWRRVVLTYQRDNVFERLIEPNDAGIAETAAIEVWFEAGDDRTDVMSVTLVPPPAIQSATLHIVSPEYARQQMPDYDLELTTKADRTSLRRSPILIGSRVRLDIQYNKPLPCPVQSGTSWSAVLGWQPPEAADAHFSCSTSAAKSMAEHSQCDHWTVNWIITDSVMMSVALVDEYGIASDGEVQLFIPARADEPPAVSMIAPVADMEVLPTAIMPLRSEARDDVSITTHRIVASGNAGPWQVLADGIGDVDMHADDAGAAGQHLLNGTADLQALGAEPGRVYELRSRAEDSFIAPDGSTHDPVYSSPRLIRVITEAVFMERAISELNRVRDQAIRTGEQQQAVRERLVEAEPENETASQLANRLGGERLEQAAVGRQIARQRRTLNDLLDRIDLNRLRNQALRDLVNAAGQALDDAARSSDSADDALSQAVQLARDETSADIRPAIEEARHQQQEVRDALTRLIEMLDQGQDSWVARNRVDRMLARQQDLARQSRDATAKMRGRPIDSLTESQRSELRQLAERQQELARDSEALLDQLRQQARQARTQHEQSALAETLDRAANQAQNGRLSESMSQAADELSQNQGERAAGSQQAAIDTLQSMQRELEELDRVRAEQLKRAVDDLVQAVRGLLADQDAQITALRKLQGREMPAESADYVALAPAMITLYANTLAVGEKTSDAGSSLVEVVSLIESAADPNQAHAITALRDGTPNPRAAESAETASLELLRQALQRLEETQQRLQQQENARKKAELIRVYRELLQLQQNLTTETQPVSAQFVAAGNQLDRRGQLAARRLADRESAVRAAAQALVEQTEGFSEALVFTATHQRLDSTAGRVVESLQQAQVPTSVIDRQHDIEHLLTAMITALGPADSNKEFQADNAGQQEAGGGRGGGSGQNQQQPKLIPPIAELRLIRELQASIHDATRSLDQNAPIDADRLSELGEAQQELAGLTQDLLNQIIQQPRPQEFAPTKEVGAQTEPSDPVDEPLLNYPLAQDETKNQQPDQPQDERNATEDVEIADDTPPSLDELLKIDDPEKMTDETLPDINEALKGDGNTLENDPVQLFMKAQQAMQQSARLLLVQRDAGLGTQRLQQEALTRLDILIAMAEQQQQQQQQQQPSQGQPNSQTPPPSQSQPQQSHQSGAAENLGQDNRPAARDPRESVGQINETRVEWGALPARARQMLMQGREETPAGMYRRLTELYYMRLAEEAQNNQ